MKHYTVITGASSGIGKGDMDGAQLINVSSVAGYMIFPDVVTYSASKYYVSAFTEGLAQELKNDLMSAVEAYYHTYAENTSDTGFEASRSHRAFGGFSAGGTTTWRVFLEGMDRFEYFMPMSGGLTLGGDGSTDTEDAALLADAAMSSGYGKRDYYVFSATGTIISTPMSTYLTGCIACFLGLKADRLSSGAISKETYDNWRYHYSELDTAQIRAKVPSQELSDALVDLLKGQPHTDK